MRRLPIFLAVVLVAGGLSACGGSSSPATTVTTSKVVDTAAEKAQIKSAYEKFFSGKTSIPDRVALLENGSKFKGLVTTFANNPLAKNVNVTVSKVTLPSGVGAPANTAKVLYTVKLGSAGLPKQTGTAVRQNGVWKVGDASLCKLVALQGSTPSACKS